MTVVMSLLLVFNDCALMYLVAQLLATKDTLNTTSQKNKAPQAGIRLVTETVVWTVGEQYHIYKGDLTSHPGKEH